MKQSPRESFQDPSTWVDKHGDVLYRVALLRVEDPQVAEDLVQETFISALEGIGRFKGGSSIQTWLIGILKHKIIDHFRKTSKEIALADLTLLGDESRGEAATRLADARNEPRQWRDTPDNLMESKEFWGAFTSCLDGLPPTFRRAFTLREMDGIGTAEICKILDVTATNLWVILHRARGKLRECLDASWFAK